MPETVTLTCAECGSPFAAAVTLGRLPSTCSPECRKARDAARKRAERAAAKAEREERERVLFEARVEAAALSLLARASLRP